MAVSPSTGKLSVYIGWFGTLADSVLSLRLLLSVASSALETITSQDFRLELVTVFQKRWHVDMNVV